MSDTINPMNIQVGDTVWFDYIDMKIPVHGRVKAIISSDTKPERSYAEIIVNQHGIGKISRDLYHIYPSKQAYDDAKNAKSDKRQAECYEETATVEGLLHFLVSREMLCRGDASDDEWAVIQRRIDESNTPRKRRQPHAK